MFGWLARLFGSKEPVQQQQQQSGPKKRKGVMVYDATLVSKLKEQHVVLVNEFVQIEKLLDAGDTKGAVKQIHHFNKSLQKHLLVEDHKFYSYIRYELADDQKASEVAGHFDNEMKSIGAVIKGFVDKNSDSNIDWTPARVAELKKELSGLAGALVSRIKAEESELYVLYRD